jgi:hypothetical protein
MRKYVYYCLAGLCALLGTVCSCSTAGETAAQILGTRSEAPVFLACKAVSETEIDFEFSLPVTVVSLHFNPAITVESVEDGDTVRVNYTSGPNPGERLTADLVVEDQGGNTINVLVPLSTRNSRIPALVINELRTEQSKPKVEFIEFKTSAAGNLGALRVYIAGTNKKPLVYEFPPIEVAANEYVVLHLRGTGETTNKDELGAKLDESGGADSCPTARDLWLTETSEMLRKTEAVYVLDQDDNVVDAVMIAENADPWWNKDALAEAADFLFNKGAWKSAEGKIAGPVDSVVSGKTTTTRTICRKETDNDNAADWYITVNSGATPGKENNPKAYVVP